MKLQSSSSSSHSFTSIKTIARNLFFSYLCRLAKALSKARSNFVQILQKSKRINVFLTFSNKKKNKNKTFFGSFRLHYNWCSSRIMHVSDDVLKAYLHCDSNWKSAGSISTNGQDASTSDNDSKLSGYLQWLEEKKVCDSSGKEKEKVDMDVNEIDKLAELFIASNHEKFRLEKEESYRRFQELLAC